MKRWHVYLCATLVASLLGLAPVLAQDQDQPYNDVSCGTWVNDVWVPNGNCPPETEHLRHGTVSGTIIAVNGHLVTVQRSAGAIVINDQPALDRKQTGKVATGREIVAYGFWHEGTFYATAIY